MHALGLAVSQLADPVFRGVILRAVLLATAVFVGLLVAAVWGLGQWTPGPAWAAWIASTVGGVLAALLALWLFVPAAVLIGTFYVDRIATAVERRYYPALPRPAGAPLSQQAWDGVVLGLQLIPLQLLTLVLTIVVPGLGLAAGLMLTGWAIGRGLFVAVAMRRMPRMEALAVYRATRGKAVLPGVALAALGVIPFANLLMPVLGTAAMVHVLEARRTV